MKNKIVSALLTVVLVAGMLGGCASFKGDEVVAESGDIKITADTVHFFVRYYQQMYTSYFGEELDWNSDVGSGESYADYIKENVVSELETIQLLDLHAEEYGVSLSDEEVQKAADAAKEFVEENSEDVRGKVSGSEETVKEFLEAYGLSTKVKHAIEDGADEEVSDKEAAQKRMKYITFGFTKPGESGGSEELSDEEKAEQKKLAEQVAARLADGEDIDEVAEELDLVVRDRTFDAETAGIPEVLKEELNIYKEGQASAVLEDEAGYYAAVLVSEFDKEATEAKKEQIRSDRRRELFNEVITKWREEVPFTVNDSILKKMDLEKLSVLAPAEE